MTRSCGGSRNTRLCHVLGAEIPDCGICCKQKYQTIACVGSRNTRLCHLLGVEIPDYGMY